MKKRHIGLAAVLFGLSFSLHGFIHAQDPNFCAAPIFNGGPVSDMTYDYGPDGLVRLHFAFTDDWAGVNTFIINFDKDCNSFGGYTTGTFSFSGVRHLMLKATEPSPGLYYFDAYDEDTNQIYPINSPPPTTKPVVAIGFGGTTYGAPWVQSPSVRIKDIHFGQKTPVLIVPGVLGTDLVKDNDKLWLDINHNFTDISDQFMDPLEFKNNLNPENIINVGNVITVENVDVGVGTVRVFNYVNGLIQEFQNQGYTENKDLFTFPYDWRYGISGTIAGTSSTTADLLQQKILDIVNQTGSNTVDVVAHSTGGLLVKKYLIDNPTDNHLGKVVFVGVPNLGAPKAFKALINGDDFGIPFLNAGELQKIAQNLPVVYDLAPTQEYVNKAGSFLAKADQTVSLVAPPQDLDYNQSIREFNNSGLINNQALVQSQILHGLDFDNFNIKQAGVNFYNIVGCKSATFGKFTEKIQSDGSSVYDFPQDITGDGTVPMDSADSLPADADRTFYALKADHSKMLSASGIRQKIVNIISGSNLDSGKNIISQKDLNENPNECNLTGHWWQIFSPLSIEIIDQDGNRAGMAPDGSVQNDIPGADYEVIGEHKFVFVPTDEGQTYAVNLKGTGDGTFTLKSSEINNGVMTGTQVFQNIPVTTSLAGTVNLASTTTLSLDNDGDGTIDRTIQPTLFLSAAESLNDFFVPALSGAASAGEAIDITQNSPSPAPAVSIISGGGGGGPAPVFVPPILSTPSSSGSSTLAAIPQVLGASTIVNPQQHPTGSLIIFPGDATVYLVNKSGKHPFVSAGRFKTLGYQFQNIQPTLAGDSAIPLGMPM